MATRGWYSFEKEVPKRKVPQRIQVIAGGIAGIIATVILHPLDLVKVRLQVHKSNYNTTWHMAKKIVHCEGPRALYNGLTAGIMRQVTYTTARLSAYYWLSDNFYKKYSRAPKLREKLMLGTFAALAGAVAGNPSEVLLVRMMADGARDPCMDKHRHRRRLYKGILHGIPKIVRNEGVGGLWRGGMLTALRSAIISCIQLASFTTTEKVGTKRKLVSPEEPVKIHVISSVLAGFLTAILTLPVDTLKTKLQVRTDKMTARDLFLIKHKLFGPLYFWRGFIVYFVRLAVHTTLAYFILEQFGEYLSKRPEYNEKRDS